MKTWQMLTPTISERMGHVFEDLFLNTLLLSSRSTIPGRLSENKRLNFFHQFHLSATGYASMIAVIVVIVGAEVSQNQLM